MKKGMAFVLALMVTLLCGCSESTPGNTAQADTSAPASQVTESETSPTASAPQATESEASSTASAAKVTESGATPTALFQDGYSFSISDCVLDDGSISLPFLPYKTAPDELKDCLGVSEDVYLATRTDASDTLDWSNLTLQFEGVPAYVNMIRTSTRAYYNLVILTFKYDGFSAADATSAKTQMRADLNALIEQTGPAKYTSTDGNTVIEYDVGSIELDGEKVTVITSLEFYYLY